MTYTQVWDAMNNQVSETMIQRDEDGAFIPFDEANTDYVEYLWWLYDGNEPTPCTPPNVTLPETIPVEDRVADLEARVDALES